MAVTVIKRPQGHILSTTANDALVTDDYGNQGALFDDPSHGLVDGDYVYVTSDIENYNGFWYVEQINSRFFYLREYATGSILQWVVDGVVTYYKSEYTHGWSCVHLPIVYKISNNRWPTNSIDTARTISNVTDNDGFCELTLSGDIKASGSADELDYVKVTTGTLAGIYQITEWVSDTNFVINVAYSAANDTALTSATIQYYYNNYNVRVRVFAGLSSSHYWTALKPYEQIVDLKLIPDTDGLVEVNINEFLKSKLKPLSNNTQLASLPNDIDSFCQFYISTAETYDETDGESLSTSTPSFTADSINFEGVAVNSMLQFKNRYSGFLSEYIANNSASKYLTLFTEPRLFAGCYFDISFLLNVSGGVKLKKEYYDGNSIVITSTELLPSYSLGLYRDEIVLPSSPTEDRVDITCIAGGDLPALSLWTNQGTGVNWTTGANPSLSLAAGEISKRLLGSYIYPDGYELDIDYDFDINTGTFWEARIYLLNASFSPVATSGAITGSTTGNYTGTVTLTASAQVYYVAITIEETTTVISLTADLNSLTISSDVLTLTETKTINIDTECSFQDIYLTWKNYLGGMDYWKFTAQKDYISDVESTTESRTNIFPTWPNSYGEFADTIDKDTSRISRDKIVVRSQNVTEDELNAIRYIVSSPLVQIMVSKNDRRTARVSPGSFVWKRDEDKLYFIEFEIAYTNTIPSQSL